MESLDTVEKQTVGQLVEILEEKYGRTRIKEVEDLVKEWMEFKPNDYEKEDKYLYAMERLYERKKEKKIEYREWFSVWMMIETRKKKGMENYELQELRSMIKGSGEAVMDNFKNKYRQLKVEPNRGKVADMYYMGHQSVSRQRFHSQGEIRREEITIRRDKVGMI